jgi:hypothetical protein
MNEHFADNNRDPSVDAARAVYGAINSTFEDWESHDIPPEGYKARFTYDVPTHAIEQLQEANLFSLRELGIHDLRRPARWDVGIGQWPIAGHLGITAVSIPLVTPGQRLLFRHTDHTDGLFDAYLRYQGEQDKDIRLMSSPILNNNYVSELLQSVGIRIPSLNLPPHERTLALSKLADKAVEFEIIQSEALPVHPTQEIVFEKITRKSAPKENSPTPVSRRLQGHTSTNRPPKRPTFDTWLRAIYTETDPLGNPRYGQVVTFEGDEARIARPTVELYTYAVDQLTGEVQQQRASTDEAISAELLSYIDSNLFEAEYGGDDPSQSGSNS